MPRADNPYSLCRDNPYSLCRGTGKLLLKICTSTAGTLVTRIMKLTLNREGEGTSFGKRPQELKYFCSTDHELLSKVDLPRFGGAVALIPLPSSASYPKERVPVYPV